GLGVRNLLAIGDWLGNSEIVDPQLRSPLPIVQQESRTIEESESLGHSWGDL
ncbi:MAG: hypothetical protein F6K03_06160, partial [Kamptonema sp. SIO4C4]|nr:hypothetical protein [Kamptonema sp. SIO4C4]